VRNNENLQWVRRYSAAGDTPRTGTPAEQLQARLAGTPAAPVAQAERERHTARLSQGKRHGTVTLWYYTWMPSGEGDHGYSYLVSTCVALEDL
jgi:hypothetical protein